MSEPSIHLLDPGIRGLRYQGNESVWVEISERSALKFENEAEALAFFEAGRDIVLEKGGEDENE